MWLTILQNACHTKRLGCPRWHTTECLLEAWMWWSVPNAETRGSLLWEREMLGHVAHNSSKRMSHQKVGMSKVAYHRMLVGGLDVVKRAKPWNTIRPSQKRQPFKGARKKCNEIVLSMCAAQCGSMEAKALSFVLRAAGSEHHMSSTRRMFTYVVGGRVGMNDTCYFTLDMKKLDPISVPY